jgi:hypothetical protein
MAFGFSAETKGPQGDKMTINEDIYYLKIKGKSTELVRQSQRKPIHLKNVSIS